MPRQKANAAAMMDLIAEDSDLEALVGYNLKRAYIVIQNGFRDAVADHGLNARTFAALSLVVQFPQITQSMLARKLSIERSGLVAVVDDLEGRALLKRVPVPGDRRVQALVPTPLGQKTYHAAAAGVQSKEHHMLADFSTEERATLVSLLGRIRQIGETE